MESLNSLLRDFRRSYREVGGEHNFNIWKASTERRTHAEVHAALEDISTLRAARHMHIEELVAYLAAGIAYRMFPHEGLRRDPRFGKKAEQVVQALLRTHHWHTIRDWHERELATAQRTPDVLSAEPVAQSVPVPAGISAGPAPGPGMRPSQLPSAPTIPVNLSGVPRRLLSKALIITIPVGALLLFWPPNGRSVQIPGALHFLAGLVVASLGSPKLRRVAIGLVIVVVIFAVIVTVWSNHVIARH